MSEEKFELTEGVMSFSTWKAGQKPNLPIIGLGSCCCGVITWIQYHNLYIELNRAFPKYDISQSWIKSIFALWASLTIDADMDELAKEIGIELPKPKLPGFAALLAYPLSITMVGPSIIWAVLLSSQIERANILFKAVADKNK